MAGVVEGVIEIDDWEDDGSELAVGSPISSVYTTEEPEEGIPVNPTVANVQEMYDERKGEMLENFYSQTVGAIFIWTLELSILVFLHYCLYLIIDIILTTASGGILIVQWCSLNMIVCTLAVASALAFIAFSERQPGVFSRHYMMCTQALCGVVSCIGIIFSAVAWKATRSQVWNQIFMQTDSSLLPLSLLAIVISNNMIWLLSLILTYSSTPFGQSNVAFMHIPVAAMLAIFAIMINEVATNGVILCQEYPWTLFTYGLANAGIVTSFIMHLLSAVEFDPMQQFPSFMHSTAVTNIRFDIYSLLHGILIITAVAAYGTVAKLSQTTFFGLMFVLLFALVTTILHSVDLGFIMSILFQADDDDENKIRALQTAFAVSFTEARDIHEAIRRTKHGKPKKGLMDVALDEPKTSEPHKPKTKRKTERPEKPKKERPPPFNPDALRADAGKLRLRHRYDHSKNIHDLARRIHEANRRTPLPTALSVFPNIPVALRRTQD